MGPTAAARGAADGVTTVRAMEDQLRAVLDANPSGIVVLEGTQIAYANVATARLLGENTAETLIGTDLSERSPDGMLLPIITAAGEGAGSIEIPAGAEDPRYWRLRHADGSEVATEVTCTPISWQGRPASQLELRDVTVAVLVYGDLAESEARYRRLVENSTDMITVHSEDGSYRFVSKGCLSLTGFTPAQIMANSPLELIYPDDLVGYLDSHIQARAAGVDRYSISYRIQHQDGSWVPVETTVYLVRDERGAVTEFQCSTRDVTERALIELSREQADRQFRVAMDNAPIGMGLMSADGRLIEVNRALCELFDMSEAQLVGTVLDELTHPEKRADAAHQLERLLNGENDSLEQETRFRRSGGEYVWALRTASAVRTLDDELSYLVVQIQDISAWKTMEETLSRQALSDPLTGLANRLMLTQRLTHALVAAKRRRTTVGIVFIDLDRFKAINDSLGHEAGDSILRQVAVRLDRSIREEDTAVRLGGDEFVVLCEDLGGLADLRLVAGRIERALSEPYRIGERDVHMTASIGLSIAADDDADSLLRHSDAAMYEAKRHGRGRTEIYDPAARDDDCDMFIESERTA